MAHPCLPPFPRLAAGLDLVHGPDGSVQLRGASQPLLLTGGLARRLLPMLDGKHPLTDLPESLNEWPAEEVFRALEMLSERGLLESSIPSGSGPFQAQAVAYWSATTGPSDRGEEVLQALARAKICLFGWGALAETVAELLRTCGSKELTVELWAPPPNVIDAASQASAVRFPEPTELEERILEAAGADLVLLALPRPAPALTSSANAACVTRGVPFLPAVVNGLEATVGPTVRGGRSACYQCFKQRLLSNTPFPAEDAAYESALDHPSVTITIPNWPPFTTAVGSWVSMEAIRLVTRFVPPLTLGQVWFLHALTGQCEAARVWKLPRCPVCSRALSPAQGGGSREGNR